MDFALARTLHVTERFTLDLGVINADLWDKSIHEVEPLYQRLRDKYLPAVRDLLMPDAFRPSEPNTEIKKYLPSHPAATSKPESYHVSITYGDAA